MWTKSLHGSAAMACVVVLACNAAGKGPPAPALPTADSRQPMPETHPELQAEDRMTAFAGLVRGGDLEGVRGFVGPDGIEILRRETGEDPKNQAVERTASTLTAEDLAGTMLAQGIVTTFSCATELPETVRCDATGEGFMNVYTMKIAGDRLFVTVLDENEH